MRRGDYAGWISQSRNLFARILSVASRLIRRVSATQRPAARSLSGQVIPQADNGVMRPLTKTMLGGSGVLGAGWVGSDLVSRRRAKAVPYEQLRTLSGADVRRYRQTMLVETTAPTQRSAFRRFFGAISGNTRGNESSSMTAPGRSETAATDTDTFGWRSRFAQNRILKRRQHRPTRMGHSCPSHRSESLVTSFRGMRPSGGAPDGRGYVLPDSKVGD